MKYSSYLKLLGIVLYCSAFGTAQNQLFIPPLLTGTDFQLNVQQSTVEFYSGNNTPTFGINGSFMSPTIRVNKGDMVTLNVFNGLTEPTTMHWHGLHVAPHNDGGPHQSIAEGSTWSPSFEILNNAGTFWYHPHGEGKTDLHVSKGLAGMFIIRDPEEQALVLPDTYGVDDIPVIVQSKAFDVLKQIAISTEMDTVIMVNGTMNPYLELPAQVVRLRLLNGSSLRSYYFGLSNNQSFFQIATDGGLTAQSNSMTRLLLSPGERSEILLDLSGMETQTIRLMSYASEMPLGIYGSAMVGMAPDTIIDYTQNKLNGADFDLLELRIVGQTASPVTSIPLTLVPFVPFQEADATEHRTLILDTVSEFASITPNLAEGPFGIDYELFDMDVVNIEVALDATEVWTLVNKTHIAHPFHIHDIQFAILRKSGVTPPIYEQGWKDVVLVPPHDSISFITRFTTFADNTVPYMYHCHLLHHEDDGMMGSFLVRDDLSLTTLKTTSEGLEISPNPTTNNWLINNTSQYAISYQLTDCQGKELNKGTLSPNKKTELHAVLLTPGIYFLRFKDENREYTIKLVKE